jgi:hypothetical protein
MVGTLLSKPVKILIIALELLIAAAPGPASAQRADLEASMKRVQQLYVAGNYGAALAEAQKLEANAKARFGANDTRYAAALNLLAGVYWAQGKSAESEALNRRALAILEQAPGNNDEQLAGTLNDLALVHYAQGRFGEGAAR